MHLFLFKSYKYFVFFSILYNNHLSYVFYLCLNCFEVSETMHDYRFCVYFHASFFGKSDLLDNIRSYYLA